ncbi:penicillin-binding protein 1C [Palleronia sediminis]|uniref:peptidoglycan glycosyltransferase n=1 Tax=Palleronia sediminis TaxID=2547833 RepID=A0A4R6ABG4_9RHOB|nr:penicillin-binding protein 1C [Palleronia sediminis]TDL78463.1 penicillin-binding protein 1C [Palleronia sediminis]
MRRTALLWLAAGLFAGALARDAVDDWIDATALPPLAYATSVEVTDRDGTLLRAFQVDDGRWRLRTPLETVDPAYLEMLVAWEDRRFWSHSGVDPLAVLRAAGQAAWHGRIVSGASTLTMQVARLLEDGPTGTLAGKLRQARVALALERRLDKRAILQVYVERAPMGANLEGVAAASRAWFAKPPRRLTPAEAALLVALPQAPERRRPDRFPDAARDARDRVLARAGHAPGGAVPRIMRDMPIAAAHLAERLGSGAPAGTRIVTTLDAGLQARVETLASRAADEAGRGLSIAVLVTDHATGAVLAHVGSAGLGQGRAGYVDMTRALRSPGSTLKPLVYGLAFDAGLAHPETLIRDRPTDFAGYAPENFDGAFRGTLSLREALRLSLNIPAVKLTEALGPAALMAALDRAGVEATVPGGVPGLAVALGGVGMTLEGLVQLYGGLAHGGQVVPLRVTPGAALPPRRVMASSAAWHVGDILSGDGRIAAKTGTSYGHRDAWAVGWDGAHVVGVWMGRPDGTPVPGAFGGDLALPVLHEVFARLSVQRAAFPPPPPDTLIVGRASLPAPLATFRGDAPLSAEGGPPPRIAFPPDGARVAAGGAPLAARVEDGTAPFTWLADGRPLATAAPERLAEFEGVPPGFVRLSVIDALGRQASARIRLD